MPPTSDNCTVVCRQLAIMEGVTVFVFLLERLPGFEIILNSTLQEMSVNTSTNFGKCNPRISNSVWNNVKQEKDIAVHNKTDTLMGLGNMVFKTEFKEKYELNVQNYYFQNEIHDQFYENDIGIADLPQGAPYLVAIFETVRNLTAQTCGGTLLSPHWIVTPAACLDVLANYKYGNETNNELESRYSIVANAVNPVEDGTVHNVTKIFIHPKYKINSIKHPNETFANSNLALLKIEPVAVKISSMKIFKNKLKKDMVIRVYGWILKKNFTGQDSMTIASITVKTLDSNKCLSSYSFPHKTAICLRANESNKIQISQMSSGGPVMVLYKNKLRLLGAVHVDIKSNLMVFLFAPHYDWIARIIENE